MAQVVIPALAPMLHKSLKEDRSLCPVRALYYYFDRTKDLRQDRGLVFVSFQKNLQRIFLLPPIFMELEMEQTVILWYELSDQEAHILHQVRACPGFCCIQGLSICYLFGAHFISLSLKVS